MREGLGDGRRHGAVSAANVDQRRHAREHLAALADDELRHVAAVGPHRFVHQRVELHVMAGGGVGALAVRHRERRLALAVPLEPLGQPERGLQEQRRGAHEHARGHAAADEKAGHRVEAVPDARRGGGALALAGGGNIHGREDSFHG
uniref:Uncharacterized protein n=1 Tax=Triticum urartu TaxID=4572 RepID=A0A8R7TM72_TRIUA